jgi:hypothetical protein
MLLSPIELQAGRLENTTSRSMDTQNTNNKADHADTVLKNMETMLWAELLSHAGFEEALVGGAGGHASGFSRIILEHVATDLAEAHPLGLAREVARAYGVADRD